MIDVADRKQQLERRLAELDDRLVKIDTQLDQTRDRSSAEAAVEREDDEVLEDLGEAGKLEMRMIEAALDRIAHDTYGICVVCGDPISEERLDILPQTPKCQHCAS